MPFDEAERTVNVSALLQSEEVYSSRDPASQG